MRRGIARRLETLVRQWREAAAEETLPLGVGGIDEGFDQADRPVVVETTWRPRRRGAD